MRKNGVLYAVVLLVFVSAIYLFLTWGAPPYKAPTDGRTARAAIAGSTPVIGKAVPQNPGEPFSTLVLQLIVIISTALIMGHLFRKIGQPAVIGEMFAGILLGPSLLGWVLPNVQAFLFPVASLGVLKLLSQLGVVLFMFVVGMQLDAQHLRKKADTAILVSHMSILFPFFLGVLLSRFLYVSLAAPGTSFVSFALFIGISMSITAFPVLARIIGERGLTNTYLGSTALACAAVDDVSAWCVLAGVVALVRSEGIFPLLMTVSLALFFILASIFWIKPWFARRVFAETGVEGKSRTIFAVILIFVLVCALFTERIGIHALFGAFLAGVCIPDHPGFRLFLRGQLERFTSVFLMPLFFVYTGLRTQVGLLNDWQSWWMFGAILAAAIVGKVGGSMLAARYTAISWRDSFSIGALMNTRGLVELVVLNIGFELGILPPRIFTMLVLMALATTFMTGPLLSLVKAGSLQSDIERIPAEAGEPVTSRS